DSSLRPRAATSPRARASRCSWPASGRPSAPGRSSSPPASSPCRRCPRPSSACPRPGSHSESGGREDFRTPDLPAAPASRWLSSSASRYRLLRALRLAGGSALLPLGPVLRPALVATVDAARVERAAHDVIAHARQILHAAPADEHDRVLLQVVALARDV